MDAQDELNGDEMKGLETLYPNCESFTKIPLEEFVLDQEAVKKLLNPFNQKMALRQSNLAF